MTARRFLTRAVPLAGTAALLLTMTGGATAGAGGGVGGNGAQVGVSNNPFYFKGDDVDCSAGNDDSPAHLSESITVTIEGMPPGAIRAKAVAGRYLGYLSPSDDDPQIGDSFEIPTHGFTCKDVLGGTFPVFVVFFDTQTQIDGAGFDLQPTKVD